MNNKYKRHDSGREPTIFTRYKQMLYGSLIAACLGLINFLVISTEFAVSFDYVRLSFYGGLLLVCVLAISHAERKVQLSKLIFIWGLTLLTSYMLWLSGGLRGSANVMYPAIMIVAALLLPFYQAILLCIAILSMVFILGLSEVHGLIPFAMKPYTYEDMINIILLVSASGVVAWLIGGDYRHMLVKLDNENNRNKEAQRKIKFLAHHDALTGLYSLWECKSLYHEMLSTNDSKLYCFFIDLDNFKLVNDHYGHPAGDSLLIEISRRLNAEITEQDIACRLGGDEFVLIFKRKHSFSAASFAQTIMESLTQPFIYEGRSIEVTASIGIALSPRVGKAFDVIRKKADSAMYKAKQLGKNRYYIYNESLHQEISRKNHIISTFKKAIRNKSLALNFQGIHDLKNNKIVAAEALLRWVKDNPDNISPGEFIPLIESTELIVDIGEWVIDEACKCCRQWHEQGATDIVISVNISPTQLAKSNLVGMILQSLEKHQLPPHCLELEITEYLLVSQTSHVFDQLSALRELGISLAIDDFGTGYSNLAYLTRFKANTLKLDRSFVVKLNESPRDRAMVNAIVNMSKILGLKVTAEGIEHPQELKSLQELGCNLGQGYYWETPCSNEEFIKKISGQYLASDQTARLGYGV